MPTKTIDLEELKAKAIAATPGVRVIERDAFVKWVQSVDGLCTMQVSNSPNFANDARFVAACSRENVLTLIRALEMAVKTGNNWRKVANAPQISINEYLGAASAEMEVSDGC